MEVSRTGGTFIERKFVIKASSTKVWDLMAAVIFQTLPLESVEIVGLSSFKAVLRWKLAFISIPMNVSGKMVDVFRPSAYGCAIHVKKGPVGLGIRVGISLNDIDDNDTKITCTVAEDGKQSFVGCLLRGFQKSFAAKILDSIENRLQTLCV
jgi:carbon monoxide dehydrogenase subunit G